MNDKQIREEWYKEIVLHECSPEAIADYWLSKFSSYKSEVEKKIEGLKRFTPSEAETGSKFSSPRIIRNNGFNLGIVEALSVLRSDN